MDITPQSYNGLPIYTSNDPTNVVAPTPINSYSILTIPAYWRAMNFGSANLASFPHAVTLDGSLADHYVGKLMKRPNAYQSANVFWRTLYFHRLHAANAYAEVTRDPAARPVSIDIRCPDDVTPFRYDAGEGLRQWYVVGTGTSRRVVAGSDMIHLAGLSYDGMTGIDPTRLLAETFQRAKTVDRFVTRYLMKGTVMRGAVEIPTVATEEQVASIVNTIRNHFQGVEADRDVIVLSGGAHLNNATLSPEQGQIIQQASYSTKQIAQATGIHPWWLFDDKDGKYNATPEQADLDLIRHTFRPLVEQIEDELSAKLLTDAERDTGYAVRLDTDALLRGQTAAQVTAVVAKVTAGIETRNEGRAELGLPPSADPEADKLKTAGDTSPQAPRPAAAAPPVKASARQPGDRFAALAPVLDAAVARVEAKTAKAFDAAAGKEGQARTVWANVFAEQQAGYVREALQPVADALDKLDAAGTLDVVKIADRYAAAIRRRASTGEAPTLADVVNQTIKGETNDQPEA